VVGAAAAGTARMTSVVRLYVVAVATVVLFLGWAFAAARPFGDSSPDPRMEALAAREQRVRAESVRVQRLVDRRWAAYGRRMAERSRAAQPVVRLTQLPPVTATRSS
jgi:hypothetical protein